MAPSHADPILAFAQVAQRASRRLVDFLWMGKEDGFPSPCVWTMRTGIVTDGRSPTTQHG